MPVPSIAVTHVADDGSVITTIGQAVDVTGTMGVEAFLASGTVTVDPVLDGTAAPHFEFRQCYYPPSGEGVDAVLEIEDATGSVAPEVFVGPREAILEQWAVWVDELTR